MKQQLTDYSHLFKKGDRLGFPSVIKHILTRKEEALSDYDLQRQIQTLLYLDVIEYSISCWAF